MEEQKRSKIEVAIDNLKSDKTRIVNEISLLKRENERLEKTIDMLEGLVKDKLLA